MSGNKLPGFGLILPTVNGKPKFGLQKKQNIRNLNNKFTSSSVFGDNNESSSDEDGKPTTIHNRDNVNQSLHKKTSSSSSTTVLNSKHYINQQLQRSQVNVAAEKEKQKALKEDPTVFDYDGVYDEIKCMDSSRNNKNHSAQEDSQETRQKPKYIEGLLKAAERRKIEMERIHERKIQKERELEGDMYGDKEKFVTEAYKAKQAELKRLQEEEQQRAEEEEKNKDLTGFYKNILNQSDRVSVQLPHVSKENSIASTGKDKKVEVEEEEEDYAEILKMNELIKSGKVKLNDSEEIVDKRQLLSAGLNVSNKKLNQLDRQREEARELIEAKRREEEEKRKMLEEEEQKKRKLQEEARKARMYVAEQKRKREEEKVQEKEEEYQKVATIFAKKTDDKAQMDAKARYLARKKLKREEESSDSE